MDITTIQKKLYDMNEEEDFYKNYYFARQQDYSLKSFLASLDMDFVRKNHLLILEMPETVPTVYEDHWNFGYEQHISAVKHNRYSPAINHNHAFFEVIYVYDGKCNQNISSQEISMRTGDVCIIPPGIEHSISVFDDSIIINVLIKKSMLEYLFFNFLKDNNILSMFFINSIYSKNVNDYIIFHSGDDFHIRSAFLYLLLENINKEAYWQQLMTNTTMNMFGLLLRNYKNSVELPRITKRIDAQRFALVRFIQENYKDITLEKIATKFNYTPEYTSKLIKTSTGMTFMQILQKVRIEKAENLLTNSNMAIQNIGYQIGYENPEHFIRTFKKVNKMTPSEYRRAQFII